MNILEGYRVEKCLSSRRVAEVYAAVRASDGQRVALKVYSGASAGARAEREFHVLGLAAGPGVPEALALQCEGGRGVLALAFVQAQPLSQLIEAEALGPAAFLRIAIGLADCVARLHAARIVHKDIRPGNILVERVTQRTWLIDFGRAALLGSAGDRAADADFSNSTLLYVSPEGTGRMDRGLDARSDLYSLGATFYHALTGRPPFDLREALELVHAHMALVPPPPIALHTSVPPTLSRIVMKLLQKEPEERYQTASSLRDDLRTCLDQIERGGAIADDFPLGTADTPQRPLFPKRLYGRAQELGALKDGFARTARGRTEIWLIKGPPGAGKSALAAELKTEIQVRGGYLADGTFDLYRRELPYAGFVSAFDALLQQRLTESSTQLERFKRELLDGLGNRAGAVADLVPDLRLIVGDVAPAPRVEPEQVRVRLGLAVRRFVTACATPEHPLVLCLDDLQWADGGSLYLIEELCLATEGCALLVLGTFRDADVDADHPLSAVLARIEAASAALHVLELGPLTDSACTELLAFALARSPEETRELAREVAHKTANVPLLVEQFMVHAHELGLLRFVQGEGWVWDQAGIAAAEIPEGVVGLLASKIERLDPHARRVLELASCVGDRFDVAWLAELGGGQPEELGAGLFRLCDEGLIAPCPTGFRFVHDRIREAAHALLSEEQRARSHHRAARLLQASIPGEARAARVLELADHFNRALGELEEDERIPVVELNLAAADRALAAGAPTTAAEYLERGRALFTEADWSARADLGFDLWMRSAACAFQLGRLDACLALLDVAEPRTRSPVQVAGVYAQRIATYAIRDQVEQATRVGLRALTAFGIHWPLHPSALRVRVEELRLALALGRRGPEAFRPTKGYEPAMLATLMLMAALGGPAARIDVGLVCLTAAWAARLMVRKGYSRGPDLALAALAANLCGRATRVRRARRYTAIARALSEVVGDPVYRYRARCVLHGSVYPWLERRVDAVEPLHQVFLDALEMGDREYAQYALGQRIYIRAFSGIPLGAVQAEYDEYLRVFAHGRARESVLGLRALYERNDAATIDRDLAALDAQFADQPLLSVHWRVIWMLTLCVLNRHADALAQAERMRDAPSMETIRADRTFLVGLSASAVARGAPRRRRDLERILASSVQQLGAWARHGPDFVHMADLLRAERAALRGRIDLARSLYATAARRAQQQGYVHHAAIACEREADLLTRVRRETEAGLARTRARTLYQRWGASTKVQLMDASGVASGPEAPDA